MLLFVGEVLVDLVVDVDGGSVSALGGGPFNAARAAARLGADVEFAGAVSTDEYGRRIRRRLAADGVGTRWVTTSMLPTTRAVARVDAGGDVTYSFSVEGTTVPSFAPSASVATPSSALFTGGLALALEPLADRMLDSLRRVGPSTIVMIDLNCRPAAITSRAAYVTRLERAVGMATIVKSSDEDLDYLAPGVDVDDAARRLLSLGSGAVLITRGDEPTTVHTAGASAHIPTALPPGPVVDTIGAGDTFCGALLAALTESGVGQRDLRGGSAFEALSDAVRSAHEAAAVVVTRRGADPPWARELASPGRSTDHTR
jgi:fructokinase